MELYGEKQLIEGMRTVRKNTIQIAEDIAEKDYGFRASSASRSVAETLVHIAVLSQLARVLHEEKRVSTIDGFDFSELIKRSELQEKKIRSKAEVIELLRAEGDSWFGWLESLSNEFLAEEVGQPGGGKKNRFEMILGFKEHEMHHRGQLMVVERMLGIVPHPTRNLQPVERKPLHDEAATGF
jgi:uncharacterized damage-inducible protein DinB